MDFNPEEFMQSMTIEGVLDTEYSPVPENDYLAAVDRISMRGPKEAGQSPIMEVFWKIDKPEDEGVQGPTSRQSVFLDVGDEGRVARGKNNNIVLGKLLDALKQNKPGWHPNQLIGQIARIHVRNRPGPVGTQYEGRIFDDVDAVVAI